MIEPTVRFEISVRDGYLAGYIRFREGEVYRTIQLDETLSVDVDREGRILGVEIVRILPPLPPDVTSIAVQGELRLNKIKEAVERRFNQPLAEEFEAVRRAAAPFADILR